MARVWYCANCGYEVNSRGRCHACGAKLTPSPLPELVSRPEDEEVGYRIDGWAEGDRGRLIVGLNDLGVAHRFEEEELVVDASDEERVDDLVALLGAGLGAAAGEEPDDAVVDEVEQDDQDGSGEELPDDEFSASVRLLADAASRLRADPTDMHADADVAEASAVVFLADSYGPFSEEQWSAVGRVTRRLLSSLGAEEALDEEIKREAAALERLLRPLTPGGAPGEEPASDDGERTVYELSDWLPDQRAELGVLLDEAGIGYDWEGDELLVPSSREEEVEGLFDRVAGGGEDDDGGEQRYHAVTELFAACGRLAGDPTDGSRRDTVLQWVKESEGPPLLGMDEVDWFRIMSAARNLAGAIEGDHDVEEVYAEANRLQDLLRSVV